MALWDSATTVGLKPSKGSLHTGSDDADLRIGRRIGPYRIQQLIARGGMGCVYLARREDDYEQRVALKLIDRGAENLSLIDRFFRERQILAQLQHPGIARILDGGTTGGGLPYFVMEYIDGEPVDRYCELHDLGLGSRLELFQQICHAVQFSHQNLVIHQDLKPSNILVTEDGTPKLLDFGIAELLQPESPEPTRRAGGRALTPSYASPEQFLGEPVTTASDVYSLGVLLYRLTSGCAPYRLVGLNRQQARDRVAHGAVEPPSKTAPPTLRRQLSGDIDAIVAKALDKEPKKRYASAAQLAEDLQRHLADLPIEAHPGTWRQRARKVMRRHKLGLTIVLLILGFAIMTSVFWRQAVHRGQLAEQARGRAEAAQAEAQSSLLQAERISEFLEDLFKSGDPDAGDLSVHEILDRGRERLLAQLDGDPGMRADLLAVLGTVYNNLSLYQEARELKEEALRNRLASDASDSQALATMSNNLGRLLYDLGDYTAAEKQYGDALAMWQRLGDERRSVLAKRNLANLMAHTGRAPEALQLHHQIVEDQQRLFGARDLEVGESLYSLAVLKRNLGMLSEAESLLREALGIFEENLGTRHTRVAAVLSSLGRALHARERHLEARRSFERALDLRLELLGAEHTHVANTQKNLAALLLDQGETQRAGELLERALVTLRAKKPAGDWTLADAESLWGSYLVALGHYARAEPVLLSACETLREAKGEDDYATANCRRRIASLYEAWGKGPRAVASASNSVRG